MYYYITNHGFGPGCIPNGLIALSVEYSGMKTIIKTDRNLTKKELYDYDMHRYCPICGREFIEAPALSRIDNLTNVCPDCGIKEAIKQYECYLEGGNE